MSKAHYITPTGPTPDVMTVRLGSARATAGVPGTGGSMTYLDEGKIVKLVGESQFDVATAGDMIEGIITSVEQALSDGWSVGGLKEEKEAYVTANGLQATEGTGNLAIGDYVVAGTQEAKGTAMANPYPKVLKSTVQIGAVPATLTEAGAQAKLAAYPWRVVSLGTAGTGAPGTTIVISRIGS
jgi:hypothetical protein